MIIRSVIVLWMALASSMAFAQTITRLDSIHFYLPPRESWRDQRWRDSIYQFEGFQDGRFYFDTGFSPDRTFKLNYNSFLGTIDILNDIGDTLVLNQFPDLKVIAIGEHLFFYQPYLGYMEVLARGRVALALQSQLKPVPVSAEGQQFYFDTGVTSPVSSFARNFYPLEKFFLIDSRNRVHLVTYNAFGRMFPEWRKEIRDYQQMQGFNYHKRSDLVQLLRYCHSLDSTVNGNSVLLRFNDIRGSWKDSTYRFHSFQDSEVTVALDETGDGPVILSTSEYPNMNYDLLRGEMVQLLENDTVLVKPTGITRVEIGTTTFIRLVNYGYIELLHQGTVSLGLQKRIRVLERAASYAHDPVSQYDRSQDYDDHPISRLYKKDEQFYLIKNTRILPATRQVIVALYPGKGKKINRYLDENKVSFEKKADLLRLLIFCEKL